MYSIFRLFILPLVFLIAIFPLKAKGEETYCITPPFMSSSISPNILFAIDVSGSMTWPAYYDMFNPATYDPNQVYEGYFVPDKVYSKGWDGIWRETSSPENCNMYIVIFEDNDDNKYYYYVAEGTCLGNKLNFAFMTRIDLLRWAITGGKPSACGDEDFSNEDCDPDIACTGDSCVLESYLTPEFTCTSSGCDFYFLPKYVEVPKERISGILQIFEKERVKPRFGALFFSYNYEDGTYIREQKIFIGDYPLLDGTNADNADEEKPYTHLKRFINTISPTGGTPTGPAMWEAYDYFKQYSDHSYDHQFPLGEGTYKDPNYFCDADKQNCKPVPCAKNFVILVSDGQWNTPACTIKNGYEFNSADPVVAAYRMHKDILRTMTSISGREYDINVTGVYALGLFLGGTGERSLKNIAVYGSFDTNNLDWPYGTDGSHWNGYGGQYPWDECFMDDCGNGQGSACTPLPPSSPDWDADGDGVRQLPKRKERYGNKGLPTWIYQKHTEENLLRNFRVCSC